MKQILVYLAILLIATSCLNTKKFRDEMQLFQKGLDSIGTYQYQDLKIKAGDNLIVNVYTQASTNQEQASVLNLGGIGKTAGTYLVNNSGQIDLPKIGLQKVEGLTMKELKKLLQDKWAPFVKDIGVNVQLEEIRVNLIGEFNAPGVKIFKTEKVSLIDAIALGSGLTDDGMRNNILIIREENGKRNIFKVDLRDANFYNSPIYQLQQNDLVVAGMNDNKFRQMASQEFSQKFGPALTFIGFFNLLLGITILITTLSR
jgi:polysaccharide biosynthesis/export protein